MTPIPTTILYTKPGCVYCDRAKDLLEDMDKAYLELPIEEYKVNYLGSVDAKCTAPQIFLDGEHVGGYSDLYLKVRAAN